MHRSPLLGAVAAATLLVTLSACGGGASEPDEAEIKADLVTWFQAGDDPLTEAQAECSADLVIEEVGVEELKDVDLGADEPPKEIQDALGTAAARGRDECELTSG